MSLPADINLLYLKYWNNHFRLCREKYHSYNGVSRCIDLNRMVMNSEIRYSSTAVEIFHVIFMHGPSSFFFILQLIISPSLAGHVCFCIYITIGLNYLVPTVMGIFVLYMPNFLVICVGLQMNSLLAHGP